MGNSKKEETNVYKALRECSADNMSQEKIAEKSQIPRDKIGAFERGEKIPNPDEIARLSDVIGGNRLCRWYCSTQCEVGKEKLKLIKVDALQKEQLGTTMLKIIYSINKLRDINIERMVEISMDGQIDENELSDYRILKESLEELGQAYGELLRIEEDGIFINNNGN